MITCDSCGPGVQALVVWERKDLTITLCGHHSDHLRAALIEAGWSATDLREPVSV